MLGSSIEYEAWINRVDVPVAVMQGDAKVSNRSQYKDYSWEMDVVVLNNFLYCIAHFFGTPIKESLRLGDVYYKM